MASFLNFEPLENQILMLLALKHWLNSSTNNAESSPFENFSQKQKCFQVPALSENENKIIKEGSFFVTGCHLNGTHSDSDVLNANI